MDGDNCIDPELKEIQERYEGAKKLQQNFKASMNGAIAYFLTLGPVEYRTKLDDQWYVVPPEGGCKGSLFVGMFILLENDKAVIQIGEGIYLQIKSGKVLWEFAPQCQLEQDRKAVTNKSEADNLTPVCDAISLFSAALGQGGMLAGLPAYHPCRWWHCLRTHKAGTTTAAEKSERIDGFNCTEDKLDLWKFPI